MPNGTIFAKKNIVYGEHGKAVKCKFCGSVEINHFGYTVKGRQRYLCTRCRRTFIDNKAPIRMRFPAEAIAYALDQFYESASLCKIQRQMQSTHRIILHHSTIYRWIIRYSQKATKVLNAIPVKASSKWIADEALLKLKDKRGSIAWFWDIMDEKTKFLLASHLSERRSIKNAQTLVQQAARRTNRVPRSIITDKLSKYLEGIEIVSVTGRGHVEAKSFREMPNMNLIERFHIALKGRARIMRSLMRRKTAKVVMDGWLAHYNFFKPHSALGGKTPAEAAGVHIPFKNWVDVVNSQ